MDIFDMAEKIVAKTGVSFEDAKKALEENGNDMLDAVIALERAGKVGQKKTAFYTTDETKETEEDVLTGEVINRDGTRADSSTTKEKAGRFAESLKHFCDVLIKCTFQVERKKEELIAVPLLVLILALVFAFQIVVPLLIVGLFLGCHYHFLGVEKVTMDFNEMSAKASQMAQDLKDDFTKNDES
ncbi:MAG: hypothetical protein IJV14_10250 [Lachnospiraceae bacterium]|nr:hypothetical protein [Lachnospiraceae bacterium]